MRGRRGALNLAGTLPAVVPAGMCAWPEPCGNKTRTPRGRFCTQHMYDGLKLGRKNLNGVRHKVFVRDGWTCHICGRGIDTSHMGTIWAPSVDHVVPVSRGGTHNLDNLRAAHLRCNMSKGGRFAGSGAR